MKKNFVFLLIFISIIVSSQEYLIRYEVHVGKLKSTYTLAISKTKTLFYKKNDPLLSELYGEPMDSCKIFKITNEFESKNYQISDKIEEALVETDIPKENTWTLLAEKNTLFNYTLQRASGNIYGKKWDVWFCNEIPISAGPYLLSGLPGIIMVGRCEDDGISFKVTEIKKVKLPQECKLKGVKKTDFSKYSKYFQDDQMQKEKLNNTLAKSLGMTGKDMSQYDPGYDPLRVALLHCFNNE